MNHIPLCENQNIKEEEKKEYKHQNYSDSWN